MERNCSRASSPKGLLRRWTEALVAQRLEIRPQQRPRVAFQHEVPSLGRPRHVIRCQLDFILLQGMLATEELLAAMQPTKGVLLAVESWKLELVEARNGLSNDSMDLKLEHYVLRYAVVVAE